MKEAYVKLETAQLLKEKEFDWDTDKVYERNLMACRYEDYPMPTQQMAMRWLREERGIHIYPIPVTGFNYVVSVYAEQGNKTYDRILSRSGRNAYEDAVDAALEYCLTNLI